MAMQKTPQTIRKFLLLFMSAIVLTGCAVSPQTINVEPRSTHKFGSTTQSAVSIQLVVSDQRPAEILGNLGGTYSETSVLRANNDIAADLFRLMQTRLSEAGYQVSSESGQLRLHVFLNELSYEYVTSAVVAREVRAIAEVAYRIENAAGTSYREGRFRTPNTQPRATRPTAEENKQFIEEALTSSIDRLLVHRPLVEFMQGNL